MRSSAARTRVPIRGRLAAAALLLLSASCGGEKPIAQVGDEAAATQPVPPSTYEPLISPLEGRRETGESTLHPAPEHALDVLLSFLSALAGKHYVEAARYYGGTYDHLRGWNPGIDPHDLPSLWRAACEFNGLQCLGRAEVVRTEQVSPTETRFHLRLFHASGEPFVQGPCCGETEATMPPRSEFAFTVRWVGSEFRVMDPPPYVP